MRKKQRDRIFDIFMTSYFAVFFTLVFILFSEYGIIWVIFLWCVVSAFGILMVYVYVSEEEVKRIKNPKNREVE